MEFLQKSITNYDRLVFQPGEATYNETSLEGLEWFESAFNVYNPSKNKRRRTPLVFYQVITHYLPSLVLTLD